MEPKKPKPAPAEGDAIVDVRRPGRGLIVLVDQAVVDLAPLEDHTCGNGRWCARCRAEIRLEAQRWLRELNVLPEPDDETDEPIQFHPWHRDLMLGRPDPDGEPSPPGGPRPA